MTLSEPGGEGLAGRLESLLFNGAQSRAMVRLGEKLVAVQAPHVEGRTFAEGAPVAVRFAVSAAIAFLDRESRA
jgi:hypothetical protein